jgi:PEGA domain-containing protein
MSAAVFCASDASAQRAVPRPPAPAHPVAGGGYYRPYYPYYRPYYYRPIYYSPFYYDPFFYHPYWSWGLGFSFGYGYGYPYGPYPYGPYPYAYGAYPYYGYYDPTGAARLQVTPRDAEVYVDGNFAGVVDDYDGVLQRLRVLQGEHELEFYREGYKSVSQRVLFRRDTTLKLTLALQPLAPGETSERPHPSNSSQPGGPPPPPDRYAPRPDERQPAPPPARGNSDAFGTLAVRVQPADAEIVIDGERWDSPQGGSRLQVQLVEGPHRVEIRKEGFRTYTANLRIRRGETETLNVSLNQVPAASVVVSR